MSKIFWVWNLLTAKGKGQLSQGQNLRGQMSTWQSPPNFIFVSWAYVPNFRLVPWILPVDFGGGVVVLVVLVVLVTGVKQSQLLDFKSWSRSGVWQWLFPLGKYTMF